MECASSSALHVTQLPFSRPTSFTFSCSHLPSCIGWASLGVSVHNLFVSLYLFRTDILLHDFSRISGFTLDESIVCILYLLTPYSYR